MKTGLNLKHVDWYRLAVMLLPFVLFWVILFIHLPSHFTETFHNDSLWMFVILVMLYALTFSLPDRLQAPICLSLTMALFALTLSYLWTSGFSDNFLIGGLLPYKDAQNYYLGANMILNGLPVLYANQATERPLFPGYLASLLWLTANFQLVIAITAQVMGVVLYLVVHQIRKSFGVLAAAVLSVFLYFFIKSWIGYAMSETLGFILGCLGFLLLWQAAHKPNWLTLVMGLTALLTGISARAGAFLIFPMLILWSGWIFRGEKRFSWRIAGLALVLTAVGYVLINTMFSRALGIPPGSSFGNFSYALYGQVRGGIGWHSAVADLGTREPSIVYRAALDYFLKHPGSLFIGFGKAYRDFFLLSGEGIFPFRKEGVQYWLGLILWSLASITTLNGLFRLTKDIQSNRSSLLLAGFIGIVLSIPFLPPIDGGTRFYAGTAPFFYALPALGISRSVWSGSQSEPHDEKIQGFFSLPLFVSGILLFLTLILPIAISNRSYKPFHALPVCSANEKPFLVKIIPGTYIDLIKEKPSECGMAPNVCFNNIQNNNTEKTTDDFYQQIFSLTENESGNASIAVSIELLSEKLRFFYFSHDTLQTYKLPALVSGCAVKISTKNQTIFQVTSINP